MWMMPLHVNKKSIYDDDDLLKYIMDNPILTAFIYMGKSNVASESSSNSVLFACKETRDYHGSLILILQSSYMYMCCAGSYSKVLTCVVKI